MGAGRPGLPQAAGHPGGPFRSADQPQGPSGLDGVVAAKVKCVPWDWTTCEPSLWYGHQGRLSRVVGRKSTTPGPDLCAMGGKAQSETVTPTATRRPNEPPLVFACRPPEFRKPIGSRG